MNILPPSQINNLPILEEVLEELRLNILDHLYSIADVLNLYALDNLDLKQKLNLLGLSSIKIGKFISLDINSKEFEYISPEFYKMYRKLNQHRGNKMSMDYVLHSAGMMNTLVHSNTQFYNQNDIFGDLASFFDFSSYRDNQFPELEAGDGYIIVPYTSNRLQVLKTYLATNPIIFNFLPAGYTFIFLSDYRNSYSTGILQYDNLLDYNDTDGSICFYINPKTSELELKHVGDSIIIHYDPDTGYEEYGEVPCYNKPLYWESMYLSVVEEDMVLKDDSILTFNHYVFDYDPYLWRDHGNVHLEVHYPRFTDDSLYSIPLSYTDPDTGYSFLNLEDFLDYYLMVLTDDMIEKANNGYEAVLNNILPYKDIWLGDYLVLSLKGSNRLHELYDHVKGMESIHAPTYDYATLTNRGLSIASQYLQREQKIVSKSDTLIQQNKQDIISDRRETDLFSYSIPGYYSIWVISATDLVKAKTLIQNNFDISENNINFILRLLPCTIKDSLDFTEAENKYNDLISGLQDNEVIFAVKDWEGNIVLENTN